MEKVFTVKQISEYFDVPEAAIQEEIASGRLRALNVAGHIRVCEFDLAQYKAGAGTSGTENKKSTDHEGAQLTPTSNFNHTWPDKKVEQFTEVREGIAQHEGKEHRVKLGFTLRNSAGIRRRRCLVIVDLYPTVEFVSADDTAKGKMASVIRNREGKQLPVGATVPPEYKYMPVGAYRDVVHGPGASNGLAVICDGTDFDTMIKHALIRYQFRKDRK